MNKNSKKYELTISCFLFQDVLKNVPLFCFPTGSTHAGPVQHFCFVLTDVDSMFTFGFCRLTTDGKSCLCILRYVWEQFITFATQQSIDRSIDWLMDWWIFWFFVPLIDWSIDFLPCFLFWSSRYAKSSIYYTVIFPGTMSFTSCLTTLSISPRSRLVTIW